MKNFKFNLQLFVNTNTQYLYPEFWAASFDAVNMGEYNLQNLVNRDFENQLAQRGDTVNVPNPPSFTAGDWVPGSTITPGGVTTVTTPVILDQSKSVPFGLDGKEQSLSEYEIIMQWGKPAAEAILESVNDAIYREMLATPYLTDATAALTESKIVDAGTALSNRKISKMNRAIVGNPDDMGTLMKLSNFSQANITSKTDVILDGKITNRYGFNFYENNAISKYTPADLTGAVNNVAGYVAGDTTMIVNGFADAANLIRKGDVFTVVGSSLQYVVQSTTVSTNTIGLTFLPALDATIAHTAVITFVATKSMLAFIPQATTLAARPYALLPAATGVQSSVINYQGIPIRISVFHNGNLGLTVQYDILFGVKNIDSSRIERILTV